MLITWKWLLPKLADLSPVHFRTQSHRGYLVRWGYVFDIAPEYLSGMEFVSASLLLRGKQIRGLPYTYLTASSQTTHWLYNLWGNPGKKWRESWWFMINFYIFVSIISCLSPHFCFCFQIRMMLQNDHWIQVTFFPWGRIIWTKKHTQPWPKKSNNMTPAERGWYEADSWRVPPGALDRFCQFFRTPLFTESATEREINAVDSEHSMRISDDGRRSYAAAWCEIRRKGGLDLMLSMFES